MIKYLVFKNDRTSGKSNVPGSPEDVACEIASVVEYECNSKERFISYPAESYEAVFASLREVPRYSLLLDQKRIGDWNNVFDPIAEKMLSVQSIIDFAYSDITQAVKDLENELQDSEFCRALDLTDDMNIEHGFDAIAHPKYYEFSRCIADYFDVQMYEHHLEGRP